MKILDYLDEEAIFVNLKSTDKLGVLEELVTPLQESSGINRGEIVKTLMERERLGSTGIGGGIGIPHGRVKNLNSLKIGVGISKKGLDFESIDGRPTYIFFLILTPEASADLHLRILAQISKYLKDDTFKENLRKAPDKLSISQLIKEKDAVS